jgi:hypothetical protein
MKNFTWPLVFASLGLNLALAWQLARRPPAEQAVTPAAVAPKPASGDADAGTTWTRLQPDNLPALVEHLRSAGFPPDVVRAIARARIGQEFQDRRKALDPDAETRPFWKQNQPDAKLMAAQRQLAREQQARLKALLGPEAENDDPMAAYNQARQFGDLPADTMAKVRAIQQEFEDRQMELFSITGGVISLNTATGDKLRELERQQRDALAQVLSPAELEQYDFRNNPAASTVRMRTAGMDLTEQEFRTLFQLQDALEQQFSMRGPAMPPPEVMRQRAEAEQQMNEQIKGLLGPDRYAEYERSLQPDYRNTSLLVSRLELPPETTQQIWSVRDDFMQRAAAVRTNRSLAPDERVQQLTTLQQEAAQAITPLVGGARGFEAYQQYGGAWLQRIAPPAQARPPLPATR